MCTYLKNMEGKKLKDLKNKSFDSIQKMFDRAFKRVNTFVDFRTDLVEGKDTAKLQSLMKVIPDEEEVAIDVVPLAVKSPISTASVKLLLLVHYKVNAADKVNAAEGVNAASEEVSIAEL
ncbi:hypothetical protein Tco_0859242, partial [Tanacetum coccineum]